MPYTLVTDTRFLNSEEQPQVCLFSGKTEGVVERRFEISKLNPWHIVAAILCGLIGLIVLVFAMKKNATVTVPQVPGEVSKRSWRRYGWFIPLYCLLPAVWCLGQIADGMGGDVAAIVLIGLGLMSVVGIALAIAGTVVWPKNDVTFKVGPKEGEITIIFPDRLEEVYETYQDSYNLWLSRRDRRGRRSNDQDAQEVDDWTEDVGTSWDQGKKP